MPSIIQTCIDRIYNVQLAWRYAADDPEPFALDERPEFKYSIIDKEIVDSFFADESYYKRRFSYVLKLGYVGAVVTSGNRWASFVWMRTPGSPAPAGLSNSIVGNGYWMINSYTDPDFRGKGLYKLNMAFLMNYVIKHEQHPVVYAVTAPDNIAPHKSLRWLGFEEHGVIRVVSLWIPKLMRWPFYATWRKGQPHATLIKGAP